MPTITFEKAMQFVIPQVLYLTSLGAVLTGFHTVDSAISYWCKQKMKSGKFKNAYGWYALCAVAFAIVLAFVLSILTSVYNWQIS